jgi:hypothetical protein
MGLPSDLQFAFLTSDPLSVDVITTPLLPCADGTVVTTQVGDGLTTIQYEGANPLGPRPVQAKCPPDQTTCVIDLPCVGDIAGEVCSIAGTYLPPSEVETVNVTWTVNGQPASASSCNAIDFVNPLTVTLTDANASDLYVDADVQCAAGAFSASKVPTSAETVYVTYPGYLVGSAMLANGSATLDLRVP